jgi:putative Mn2+ efflux pump MntP
VTAILAASAVLLGHHIGTRFRKPAEIIGGVVLIGIGVQVLIEHLVA